MSRTDPQNPRRRPDKPPASKGKRKSTASKPARLAQWAPVTNISSQRWHAFRDDKAICGVPWYPMRHLFETSNPGKHLACVKCEKLLTLEGCSPEQWERLVARLEKRVTRLEDAILAISESTLQGLDGEIKKAVRLINR